MATILPFPLINTHLQVGVSAIDVFEPFQGFSRATRFNLTDVSPGLLRRARSQKSFGRGRGLGVLE
jgi:hypothetical protein